MSIALFLIASALLAVAAGLALWWSTRESERPRVTLPSKLIMQQKKAAWAKRPERA